MEPIKLHALDLEDLDVISAHLQDAVLTVGDMAYLPREQRLAAVMNRFDWSRALSAADGKERYERRRCALRFERVRNAELQSIRLDTPDAVLELLAIQFEETKPPEGTVTLVFSGGSAIRLHVECIEAELKDLGPVWRTTSRPEHEIDEAPSEANDEWPAENN